MKLGKFWRSSSKQQWLKLPLPARQADDRPEDGTPRALRWDYEMGQHYAGLSEHPAWKDLVERCFVARDSYYATLRSGEGNQDAARGGIEFIEWMLAIPANMIVTGKDSEEELRRMSAERNGANE